MLVRLEGVSKSYHDGEEDIRVLRDLDLALPRGDTTSLAGASGSGKSTLVGLLAGLTHADSGRVLFDGRDITAAGEAERAQRRAERVGVVMQRGNLVPFLTAQENVEMAIGLAGGRQARVRAEQRLGEVGLHGRRHHLARRLSGGESQRVALAVAVANEPDLLLADEVAGELDPRTAANVMQLILDLSAQRGMTVLIVTHSVELAALAHHRLRMHQGQAVPA